MGALSGRGGTRAELRLHTLVGRSARNDLVIDDARVSAQHALIYWSGSTWMLKDLASRNGSYINGRRVRAQTREPLKLWDQISFGSLDEALTLAEDDAPPAVARRVDTGQTIVSEEDVLVLVTDAETAAIMCAADGFWLEQAGNRRRVKDGERIEVGGVVFELALPQSQEEDDLTIPDEGVVSVTQLRLHFEVSRDEEHVEITLKSPGAEHRLPVRAFGYALLELARARLRDQKNQEVPESEHGWVYADELATRLGIDITRLNVDIFRARRQFERMSVADAATIVERRLGTRQIRLGTGSITVSVGDESR